MTVIEHDILEGIMPPMKPAIRHVANAIRHPSGKYLAQYAAPGMVPLFVSRHNVPSLFDTEEDARTEAALVLVDVLKSRKRDTSKPEVYRKLTGDEFAVLLAEAGLTPTFFAYLYGTTQERVIKWIDGVDDVPHPVRLILETWKRHPETIDTSEAVTESVTTQRRPGRA